MIGYIINEDVTPEELVALKTACKGYDVEIHEWPHGVANLPSDINVAILIVRNSNTQLEETRTIAAVNAAIRIVCVYLEDIAEISEICQRYCSSKVSGGLGALGDALMGNDQIQEKYDGSAASKNPQKHHKC
jgi:hypothetical protein